MGTRLRNLRKELKGKQISDEDKKKAIGGTGRLSDKNINLIQNYYGMAIRQNSESIYGMKKSIAAVLYHVTKCK